MRLEFLETFGCDRWNLHKIQEVIGIGRLDLLTMMDRDLLTGLVFLIKNNNIEQFMEIIELPNLPFCINEELRRPVKMQDLEGDLVSVCHIAAKSASKALLQSLLEKRIFTDLKMISGFKRTILHFVGLNHKKEAADVARFCLEVSTIMNDMT